MWVTIFGKISPFESGSAIVLPPLMLSRAAMIASSITLLPDVLAVMLNPSRIGTPLVINVPSVLVNLATAVFRINSPTIGSLRNIRSMTNRPLGVP